MNAVYPNMGMKDYWNQRYKEKAFIYGEDPNLFFAEQVKKLKPGKLILPCEGEGRNAVFAANLNWEVQAFDLSFAAKMKSLELATKKDAQFDYRIGDARDIEFDEGAADVIAFIYAHFPDAIRKTVHRKAISWLKPGGKIIIEAFHTAQINMNSGGPKEISMLYCEEHLLGDFESLQTELIESVQVELNEGQSHQGLAEIIRYIGIKA
ncbi:MAG: class I SAM-dependent methyltransferase [Bacteroidota bacterium]|nr:class I SAM-dependent methyltransferase [Bacteroidota bacterium]